MQPTTPGRLRPAIVGLIVVFVVSACTASAAEERPRAPEPEAPSAVLPVDHLVLELERAAGDGVLLAQPSSGPLAAPSPAPSVGAVSAPPAQASAPPASPAATPAASPSASGEPRADRKRSKKVKVIRLKPRPRPGRFSMNLYQQGDFVHQQTKDWCVAGSTQTMMNIMERGRPNRSAAFQKRLYVRGRRLSPNKAKLGPIGVDVTGWAELLNTGGYGPYKVDGARSRARVIRMAAKAIRETGRPVGLVVWRGAHSWVMSGFAATADPAYTDRFKVTHVFIQDVWYPYVSTIWGASRPPNARVPVAALGEDYLRFQRPGARYPKRDGKFMLVLPTLPRNTVAR